MIDPLSARHRDTVSRWSLPAIGCVFLVVTCAAILASPRPIVTTVVLSGVNVVFSAGIVLMGTWLALTHDDADLIGRVTRWGIASGTVLMVLAVWAVVSGAVLGGPYPAPIRNVIGGANVGILAGTVAGYYHERSRKQAKELADLRSRRIEELASLLSHDLQTPLSVAYGRLRRLQRRHEHDDDLVELERALNRIEALVEDTLLLVEHGENVDDPVPIELGDFARYCWRTVETAGADLAIEDDAEFRGDSQRLVTLFENLFRNAVEHGSTDNHASRDQAGDGVTVTVGTLPDGFFVEDDGVGIPADERRAVFELGYTTASDGNGLGLAIVREIVDEHGWEIEATASESGGARFEVTGVDVEPLAKTEEGGYP